MARLIVGIGEAIATRSAEDEVKTYALGSCVAIVMLDPKTRTVGLAHIALPDSKIDPEKAERQPAYFADTGIPYLLKLMCEHGSIPHKDYIIKLLGGANVITDENKFSIGRRNVTAIKKILWEHQFAIANEDVGESHSRTVTVFLKNGKVFVTTPNGEERSI